RARAGELLLVRADLLVQLGLARLELLELLDGRVLPRQELFLFLGVERLLFRGDGEIFLEPLQLRAGALALAAALAQILFRGAEPLVGDDARVVRGAQLFLERLQLRGDAARSRLLG